MGEGMKGVGLAPTKGEEFFHRRNGGNLMQEICNNGPVLRGDRLTTGLDGRGSDHAMVRLFKPDQGNSR